jgi:predicted FMN-binding regulatory protein PaiB
MYVPAHFAGDLDQIEAFVRSAGAADLVTFDGTRLVASLLPVIWDTSAGTHGRLLGHLALANPQWSSAVPQLPALAIVHGPQAYISPKDKLSQNRSGADRAAVISALQSEHDPAAWAIAELMESREGTAR